MKRHILPLLTLLLLGSTSLCAQTARQVLDQTVSLLQSYPSATARFTAMMGGKGGMNGHLTLQGRKFVMEGNDVMSWFDGKTQWVLLKSSNEVNVSTPTAQELQRMNPYYFLSLYKSDYTLSMKTEGRFHLITMTAQKRQPIATMEVSIDRNTHLPIKVVITTQRGTQSTYTVSNLRRGKKLPDSTFRFNPKDFPRANVIDLR